MAEPNGNIMISAADTPRTSDCSPEERQARVDLAKAYRLFDWLGITDLIHTHISIRVPGRHDHFLQLPYGHLFSEARASDMVKCDTEGRIISDPTGLGISVGGFCIHSAIHQRRADAACVMHVHSEATIAVSSQKRGLLPLTQHAMRFHERIAYLDYCGAFDTDAKRASITEALGEAQVLMLRNHGPLVVGSTLWQCFSRTYYLERACRMQIAMQSASRDLDEDLVWPDPEHCRLMARAFEEPSQGVAMREWAALTRMLDRQGADYAA
jgi:ribulose-5-phosphate 4-epimerase/fuculose-1-phosphate aldolase